MLGKSWCFIDFVYNAKCSSENAIGIWKGVGFSFLGMDTINQDFESVVVIVVGLLILESTSFTCLGQM